MDVLDSPVPALVGVQAPFDKLNNAFDGLVVLDLDARQFSVSRSAGLSKYYCCNN